MLSFRLKQTFSSMVVTTPSMPMKKQKRFHEETNEANSQRCGVGVYKGYIRELRFGGGVAFGTLKTSIFHGQTWTYIRYGR